MPPLWRNASTAARPQSTISAVERDSSDGNATPVATARRVTAVLDAFLAADADLGVTELAARLGLAKSVVHRLLAALTNAEYVRHDPATRRYSLGPQAIR